ncbi:MAG: DUF5106 domain-containing protein [Bacteroidales bacterium]|nr:DUF5106 domain-containing protein [Bacteroidales bacterium]
MKKNYLLLFLFIAAIVGNLSAQKGKSSSAAKPKKGHELIFNVKDSKDQKMYLVIHYNEKLIIKDSITPVAPGKFIFRGEKPYDDGMYSLVSEQKHLLLNFIIDRNQFFEYNLDTTGNVDNFNVINSPENAEMLKFQRRTALANKQATEWNKAKADFEEKGMKDSVEVYQKKLMSINDQMLDFIHEEVINPHPDYLFSKMQKSYMNIEVPEITKTDGTPDHNAQACYYRTHYWDNFDLTDHRFIYIPSFEPKLKDYFLKLLYHQESDTINKYVDMFIAKTVADTFMYHYCVDWLSYNYETSKIIGHDAVFTHIAKTNQLAGKCYWLDEDIISKYQKRVGRIEPTLIGKIAPELIIPDTNLSEDPTKWISSYSIRKPYTIIWFYDPNCPTCKKESKALYQVYDSLEVAGTRNFEVYAIGNDDTIDAWKKYVKENNYPWIQVGGNKGNIDYLEHFGIYDTGNPAMFVLNSRHEIILNKRIDMHSLPQFLEEYEKIERLKAEQQSK